METEQEEIEGALDFVAKLDRSAGYLGTPHL